MEGEVFFDRYKLCRDPQGKPEEAGRAGPAIVYKARDEQSNEPVMLQLVPLAVIDQTRRDEFEARTKAVLELDHINIARVLAAGVEHGYFAFVTEYLAGETADAWIVAHGPLPADAVLRIGLQVVRATAAAAFRGLTHRAIQPSNIIILHGESPSGGWPFIKVLNFGIAALELHGESTEARELSPAVVPQFASPEHVLDQQIDFRSEMYSLGATMCFLLTGAVPLPSNDAANLKRRGLRRLPELRSVPKTMRRLLSTMLAENPDDRPVDPVALERNMVAILGQLERRQAISRKLGIPLAVNVQKQIMRSPSPYAQVVRGGLAFAAIVMILAAISGIVYSAFFQRPRPIEEIGVPIGVPTAETTNVAPQSSYPVPAKDISAAGSVSVAQASPAGPAGLSKKTEPVRPTAPPPTAQPPSPSSSSTTLAEVSSSEPHASRPAVPETSSALVAASTATPAPEASDAAANGSIASAKAERQIAASTPTISKSDEPSSKTNDRTETSSSSSTIARADTSTSRDRDREAEPPAAAPEERDVASATTSREASKREPRLTRHSKSVARNRQQIGDPAGGRWTSARFLGTTPGGRMLFRLPSGKIVAMSPRYRRAPVAVRPRAYRFSPEPPPGYYAPPSYGYPLPDD